MPNSVRTTTSSSGHTIVGGNDSNDGSDSFSIGAGDDLVFGNGGNDTLLDSGGSDTFVGGFGNDRAVDTLESNLFFGNQGNDTLIVAGPSVILYGGQGNDDVSFAGTSVQVYGNEGADTIGAVDGIDVTVVGGNDSADGDDLISFSSVTAFVLGNGGADTLRVFANALTVVGGQGGDSVQGAADRAALVFGNEGNDTLDLTFVSCPLTALGGQGNDTILSGSGRDTLQGNEGNDTIRGNSGGGISIDTIAGGTGNDVFAYASAADDGNNATGGGPVEFITDVDFSVDRFQTTPAITFATNVGAGTGTDLASSANNAINSASALAGGALTVAAQFTFGGRTYLSINLAVAGFLDTDDLLLDITGATGSIGTSNFV